MFSSSLSNSCSTFITKDFSLCQELHILSIQPLLAAFSGWLFFKERVSRSAIFGLLMCLGGMGSLVWMDRGHEGTLLGDGLALVAAFLAVAYLTVGRHVRKRIPLPSYMFLLYSQACLWAGLLAVGTHTPLGGYSPKTWWWIFLLALLPSTLGHNMVNFAVRRLPLFTVHLVILSEPIFATLLAWPILHEKPEGYRGLAALVLLAGAIIGVWGQKGGR